MPNVVELGNRVKARSPEKFSKFSARDIGYAMKRRNPQKYADYDEAVIQGTQALGFSPPSPLPLKRQAIEPTEELGVLDRVGVGIDRMVRGPDTGVAGIQAPPRPAMSPSPGGIGRTMVKEEVKPPPYEFTGPVQPSAFAGRNITEFSGPMQPEWQGYRGPSAPWPQPPKPLMRKAATLGGVSDTPLGPGGEVALKRPEDYIEAVTGNITFKHRPQNDTEAITQGVTQVLAGVMSPAGMATIFAGGGLAHAARLAAQSPKVAAALLQVKGGREVLKGIDLASRTALPATVGAMGAEGTYEGYEAQKGMEGPEKTRAQTQMVASAILMALGAAGAVRGARRGGGDWEVMEGAKPRPEMISPRQQQPPRPQQPPTTLPRLPAGPQPPPTAVVKPLVRPPLERPGGLETTPPLVGPQGVQPAPMARPQPAPVPQVNPPLSSAEVGVPPRSAEPARAEDAQALKKSRWGMGQRLGANPDDPGLLARAAGYEADIYRLTGEKDYLQEAESNITAAEMFWEKNYGKQQQFQAPIEQAKAKLATARQKVSMADVISRELEVAQWEGRDVRSAPPVREIADQIIQEREAPVQPKLERPAPVEATPPAPAPRPAPLARPGEPAPPSAPTPEQAAPAQTLQRPQTPDQAAEAKVRAESAALPWTAGQKAASVKPEGTKWVNPKFAEKPEAPAAEPVGPSGMIADFTKITKESMAELRSEISDVDYGPIKGESGTIRFKFRGKEYEAPEPTGVVIGASGEGDASVALKTVLNKTARRVSAAPKAEAQPAASAAKPFGDVSVADESKYFGSKVAVAGEGRSKPEFTGTVHRVLNNGELVEVHPELSADPGQTFRVSAKRVSVVELKQEAPKQSNYALDKAEASSPGLVRDYLESSRRQLEKLDAGSKEFADKFDEVAEYRNSTNLRTPPNYEYANDLINWARERQRVSSRPKPKTKTREDAQAEYRGKQEQRAETPAKEVDYTKELRVGGKPEFTARGSDAEGNFTESVNLRKRGSGWEVEREYYDKPPGPENKTGRKEKVIVAQGLTKAEARAEAEAYLRGQDSPGAPLRAGIQFSEYKPGTGRWTSPAEGRFSLTKPIPYKGENWHTDGHALVRGDPPKYWKKTASETGILPDLSRVIPKKKGKTVSPVAVARPAESVLVFFSDGTAINTKFFDYINKQHNPTRWTSEGKVGSTSAIQAWKGNKLVGVVMPVRVDTPPPGVQRALADANGHPAPSKPAPAEKPSTSSRESQRGSISRKPLPPEDPDIEYARGMIKARKEALKKARPGVVDMVKSAHESFVTAMVDNQFPVLRKEHRSQGNIKSTELGGQFEVIEEQKYDNKIDMTKRASQIAFMLMEDKGLVSALQELRNQSEWDLFSEYLRAKQSEIHTRRRSDLLGDPTGRNEKAVYEEVRGEYYSNKNMPKDVRAADRAFTAKVDARFGPIAEKLYAFSRDVVDYAVKHGLLDAEGAAELKRYPWVPMRRAIELMNLNEEGVITTAGGKSLASQYSQGLVKKMTGSKGLPSLDPVQTLMGLTVQTVLEGLRNDGAVVLGKRGGRLDAEKDASRQAIPGWEDVQEVPLAEAHKNPNQHFFWREDGVQRASKAPADIIKSVKSLDEMQLHGLEKALFVIPRITKVFTTGVMNPWFTAVNMSYDMVTSMVQADVPMLKNTPLSPGYWSSIGPAIAGGKRMNELKRLGGGFDSYAYLKTTPEKTGGSLTAANDFKVLVDIRNGLSVQVEAGGKLLGHVARHPFNSWAEVFSAVESAGAWSERAGRLRIYEAARDKALGQGRTLRDAQLIGLRESNNALPNYLRLGDYGRVMNLLTLYYTAGVQSTRSFYRAAETNPAKTVRRMGMFALATAGLTAWSLRDEDSRKAYIEAYRDVQKHEKNDLFIITNADPVEERGGKNYRALVLPVAPGPYEAVIRATQAAVEKLFLDDEIKFQELLDILVGLATGEEARGDAWISKLTPHQAKVPVEWALNRNLYTGRETVPWYMEDAPVAQQAQPYTPGTLRLLGEKTGASPAKLHQAAKGILGSGADPWLRASDNILNAAGVIPDDQVQGVGFLENFQRRLFRVRGGAAEQREREEGRALGAEALEHAIKKFMPKNYLDTLTNHKVRFNPLAQKFGEDNDIYTEAVEEAVAGGADEKKAHEIGKLAAQEDYVVRSALRIQEMTAYLDKLLPRKDFSALSTDKKAGVLKDVRTLASRAATQVYEDLDDSEYKDLVSAMSPVLPRRTGVPQPLQRPVEQSGQKHLNRPTQGATQ